MRKLTKIVVHHSAVVQPDLDKLISSIEKSHKERLDQPADKNGSHIAYHYIIWVDWTTVQTRDINSIWWHASNYDINKESIWVCLSGDFDNEEPTEKQYEALRVLINMYPDLEVHFHREYDTHKTCPWRLFDVLELNKIIMWLYEETFKTENPDWIESIKKMDQAFASFVSPDWHIVNGKEFIYFLGTILGRIERKIDNKVW